jgi:hypothetical protein
MTKMICYWTGTPCECENMSQCCADPFFEDPSFEALGIEDCDIQMRVLDDED